MARPSQPTTKATHKIATPGAGTGVAATSQNVKKAQRVTGVGVGQQLGQQEQQQRS
jgi:hypothetical protein